MAIGVFRPNKVQNVNRSYCGVEHNHTECASMSCVDRAIWLVAYTACNIHIHTYAQCIRLTIRRRWDHVLALRSPQLVVCSSLILATVIVHHWGRQAYDIETSISWQRFRAIVFLLSLPLST